jgi:hypothetical protein
MRQVLMNHHGPTRHPTKLALIARWYRAPTATRGVRARSSLASLWPQLDGVQFGRLQADFPPIRQYGNAGP